jgi:hypothetical protein
MNKHDQAFMEFLMTYGWATLLLISAIGILAYFGVFAPKIHKLQIDNQTFITNNINNDIDTSDIVYDNSTNPQWVTEIGKVEPINLSDLNTGSYFGKSDSDLNTGSYFGKSDSDLNIRFSKEPIISVANESFSPIFVIYQNGSFYVRNGTEQQTAEQLAKIVISFNSYLKGYCEGLLSK